MTDRASVTFPSRVGVFWQTDPHTTPEVQQVARDIEALGYGSLFFPEGGGRESLMTAAGVLAGTERLVVGTGIANIHLRHPRVAEGGARSVAAMFPHRFVLGLGVSHQGFVEQRGGTYAKPLSTMRDYLGEMDALADEVEPGMPRPLRLLAALGPKMIELSGTAADGALPYLVTPEQTRATRDILGPDRWIVSEQAVALGADADDTLRRAHESIDLYTQLPNYRNSWLRQGFTEADVVRGGSDRLATALVARGDAETAAAALTAHLDAGADHVAVQIVGDGLPVDPRPALRELAAALELTDGR